MPQPKPSPRPNHYLPRTTSGKIAVGLYLFLFLLSQPPLVFWLANRIEPMLFGMPFLYVYLLLDYFLLIGVLVWALRRGV